jgi:hypothetical protein
MRLGLGLGLVRLGKAIASFVRDGLKLYYPFKDNNPELLLSGATSFDGTDDYIDLGDSADWDMGSNDFSLSCYIKTSKNYSSAYGRILMYGESGGAGDKNYSLYINTSNYLGFGMDNDIAGKDAISSSAYNDNLWHNLVGVRDGTNIKLYIDGVLITTTAIGDYGSLDMDGEKLLIGVNNASGTLGNYFDGSIANVGIWNRALSASEIESIYWKGQYADLKGTELTNLVSWYNLKETEYSSELITNGGFDDASNWDIPSGGWDINSTTSGKAHYLDDGSGIDYIRQNIQLIQGAVYRLKFTLSDGTNSQLAIYNNVLGSYVTLLSSSPSFAHFTNTANGTYTIDFRATASGSFLIAGHPGATTLTDAYSASSPFLPRIQDKATPKGAVALASGSTSFDGSNDTIIVDGNLFSGTNATMSGWIKADNLTSSREIFFGSQDSSGTRYDYLVAWENSSIRMYVEGILYDTSVSLNSNIWYFITLTTDGSNLKLYVDGSLKHTVSVSSTLSSGTSFIIGGDINNSNYFGGSLAKFGCKNSKPNTRYYVLFL